MLNDNPPVPKFKSPSIPENLTHPLEKLIRENPHGVAKLLARAQELETMGQKMANILPEEWRSHCCVANVRDTVLVLQADSSALATRLRFLGPQILDYLRGQGYPKLTATEVRITS